jgi:pimeloyl-ACP methyl ester carboxylesterase
MSATADTRTIDLGGRPVRVLRRATATAATAPPVLVLHGWGTSIDVVASITAGLGAGLEVVAPDFPGFGDSPPPDEPWSVGDYAELVVALADELGIGRFSLLGHSFGARVAIVLATTHPDRVARMVFTGAAGIKPRRKPSYYGRVSVAKAGRVVGAVGGEPGRKLQQRMRERVASRDWLDASEAMRGTFRLVVGEDLSPRLPAIQAPTLLLWGRDDEDTPLWMAERMEAAIPNAGLVVLEGGHYVYAERAGELNHIATHFLAEAT